MDKSKRTVILIIPVIYLIWTTLMYLFCGEFSLSRSDPEYPYLLNGLACATFHFDNIGLISHPGTPFALITGIFLSITHILVGQGSITDDVLMRPELYLSSASLYLTFITTLLLIWVGRVATKNNGKMIGAIMLQSTLLLSGVLVDMSIRYSADRILAVYVLVFAGLAVNYLQSHQYSSTSFSILSGVLMGVSLATKFNFLPVLVIPLLMVPGIRNRIIYLITVVISFFISVIPIMNKLKDFRRFMSDLATHDGLYGQGSRHVLNVKSLGHNFVDLMVNNPAYAIVLLLVIGLVFYFIFNKKKAAEAPNYLAVLQAFLLASCLGMILVLKHYKVYYFIPVLSLSGLLLFVIWKIFDLLVKNKKLYTYSTVGLVVVLFGVTLAPLNKAYQARAVQKKANLLTSRFYAEHVTSNDWLFIEPTWEGGPMVENALVYGISYVAHRENYYRDFHRFYPNVLTWEGTDHKPTLFRTAEADPESILYSGRDIYIYSSPARNAHLLLNYLDVLAANSGTGITKDTVFINPMNADRVIRVRALEGWTTLSKTNSCQDPVDLSPGKPVIQEIPVPGVMAGDYIEITVQIRNNGTDPSTKSRIIARSTQSDQDGVYLEDSGSLQNIGNGWQLLRLRGKISATPADGKLNCLVYYPGHKKVTIQDLQIRHMGIRSTNLALK